jgi:hypothetical protein
MYRTAFGALALGLALSACTGTRQAISTGCAAELKFHGTPYCTYGDTTRDDRYSPTNQLGLAQPWHAGEAIPSEAPVPVRGFNFVSPSRVIAVRVPGTRHQLELYLTEYSTARWRKSVIETIDISSGHR